MFAIIEIIVLIPHINSKLVAVVFVVDNSVHPKIRAGVSIYFKLESVTLSKEFYFQELIL